MWILPPSQVALAIGLLLQRYQVSYFQSAIDLYLPQFNFRITPIDINHGGNRHFVKMWIWAYCTPMAFFPTPTAP